MMEDKQDTNGDMRRLGWKSGLRLGLLNSFFFGAIYVAVFGGLCWVIHERTHEDDFEMLREHAAEFGEWYMKGGADMLERRITDRNSAVGEKFFVRLLEEAPTRVIASRTENPVRLKSEVLALPVDVDGKRLEISEKVWAVASVRLKDGGVLMQIGKDVSASERWLEYLRNIIALAFIPAMLAGIVGSAFFTHRAIEPVRRIALAMRGILKTGDLSGRVDGINGRGELNEIIALFNKVLDQNGDLIVGMRGALDNVSHDFRTPLTRFRMVAERALAEGADKEMLREALVDCLEESQNLNRLLGVLMEVSAAESGVMKLREESFSLGDLVRGVAELYEVVAEEKGVELVAEISDEIEIHADKTRLGQVVANLLDNAVKFTPEGKSVRLTQERNGGFAVLRVADEGTGICGKDQAFIWDRLYRAEHSRTSPGMGLGLSFVKAITEAHGGSVAVESEEGNGAVFTVRIPIGEIS